MPPKLPPLAQLDHLKLKSDIIPEIYFYGQIVGGVDFECSDALLCQMTFKTGQYWQLIHPAKQKTYQTQTTYAQSGEMHIWSHPFDLHYKVNQLSGWPKVMLKVWRFNDSISSNDFFAYGVTYLPKNTGFNEIECQMWTPYGDWKYQSLSHYMDSVPRLNNINVLANDMEKKKKIFSKPAGKVVLQVETIRKNFKTLHIS